MDKKVSGRQGQFLEDKVHRTFNSSLTLSVFLINACEIEVKLFDGEVLKGELKECGNYDILLMIDGKDLIITKHAIVSVKVLSRL